MTTSTTEMPKLRLGDRVSCSAYIRRSGKYFEVHNGPEPIAYLCDKGNIDEKGNIDGEQVDGYETCDRYTTETAPFTGVYVGTTTLCTSITCDWHNGPYEREGYRCMLTNPKPFAIVYYANNKKRLVPMDSIEKVKA